MYYVVAICRETGILFVHCLHNYITIRTYLPNSTTGGKMTRKTQKVTTALGRDSHQHRG